MINETIGGQMSERHPIRVGIIGLGRATALMLPALEGFPLVRVTAAADPRRQAREAFGHRFDGRAYESAEGLCEDAHVDAVIVATPPNLHAAHVIMAARSGKHVLVEKPMAPTLAECDEMIAAAASSGVHLLVGHTLAYSPPVRAIASMVASREFGGLGSIMSLYYTDFLYRPRRQDELSRETGGGIFLNQLPHLVDCIRLICGGVVEEVAAAGAWAWDARRPVVAATSAFLKLGSGATAVLIYSGYDRFDSRVWTHNVGEDGEAVASDPGAARRRLARRADQGHEERRLETLRFGGGGSAGAADDATVPPRQPQPGTLLVSCEQADLRPSPEGVHVFADDGLIERRILQPHWPAGRTEVLEDLHRAVTRDEPTVHDGEWGRATMEVCLAIEAAADGVRVPLGLQSRVSPPVEPPDYR